MPDDDAQTKPKLPPRHHHECESEANKREDSRDHDNGTDAVKERHTTSERGDQAE
jgi:hypothetical protein